MAAMMLQSAMILIFVGAQARRAWRRAGRLDRALTPSPWLG
jgi:hypothetical protein